jgi:hypothetical protein
MSKVLAVLQEVKECSYYWSDYDVPIGIHERIDAAIAELLAQPQKTRLIEVYSELLKSLIVNNGAGLKELKAFDLETYNKLKDIFGATRSDHKGKRLEDLQKARAYLDSEICLELQKQ